MTVGTERQGKAQETKLDRRQTNEISRFSDTPQYKKELVDILADMCRYLMDDQQQESKISSNPEKQKVSQPRWSHFTPYQL